MRFRAISAYSALISISTASPLQPVGHEPHGPRAAETIQHYAGPGLRAAPAGRLPAYRPDPIGNLVRVPTANRWGAPCINAILREPLAIAPLLILWSNLHHASPRCPARRARPALAGAGLDARLDQRGRERGEVAAFLGYNGVVEAPT